VGGQLGGAVVARVQPLQQVGQRGHGHHRQAELALDELHGAPGHVGAVLRGALLAARIIAMDSRTEVPAEMTSSMMSTRPFTGAPTSVPPSPWSLASLRL
jgi:hypothetical protein